MTKGEFKKLEGLKNNDEIRLVLFKETVQGKFVWKLLSLNAQSKNDPENVIGLVETPISRNSIQEFVK